MMTLKCLTLITLIVIEISVKMFLVVVHVGDVEVK